MIYRLIHTPWDGIIIYKCHSCISNQMNAFQYLTIMDLYLQFRLNNMERMLLNDCQVVLRLLFRIASNFSVAYLCSHVCNRWSLPQTFSTIFFIIFSPFSDETDRVKFCGTNQSNRKSKKNAKCSLFQQGCRERCGHVSNNSRKGWRRGSRRKTSTTQAKTSWT